MNPEELKQRQAPLKEKYRETPAAAQVCLRATSHVLQDSPSCRLETAAGSITAGLHPGCGGDGTEACSAEMLLDALAGCAGVTLGAVSRAMRLPVIRSKVEVEGDLDFRGTLGIDREVPVGFTAIRVRLHLEGEIEPAQRDKLCSLVDRYCVVSQTLNGGVDVSFEHCAYEN